MQNETPLALQEYHNAKRSKNNKPELIKFNTQDGTLRFYVNTDADRETLQLNLTAEYFAGPWFSMFPIEKRMTLRSQRWLELGAKTGWFAAKLYKKMTPRMVTACEASSARFGFLAANNAMNIPCGDEVERFVHLVPERTIEKHPGRRATLRISGITGYADSMGEHELGAPVGDWQSEMRMRRYTSIKIDMDGYEGEFILADNVQFGNMSCAMVKVNPAHHSKKDFERISTKLSNSFPDGAMRTEHPDGSAMFFCH